MRYASTLVLQYDVERVDDSWDVTEDGQQDVDTDVSTATSLEEDTQRWEDDGEGSLQISGKQNACNRVDDTKRSQTPSRSKCAVKISNNSP